MPEKVSGNIVKRGLRSADFSALRCRVPHTRLHALADDTQLQLRKHARHLDKGVRHRVKFAAGAIYLNTADDTVLLIKLVDVIRFTVKRKSRSEHEFVIRAALGYNDPGLLIAVSSPGSQYDIVVGYVELLPTWLCGGEGKRLLSSI